MRWRQGSALALAAGLALGLLAPGAQAAGREDIGLSEAEWEVLRLVNEVRISEGLSPLSACAGLQEASHIRAADLVTEYRSDHTRPDGSDCFTVLGPLGLASWAAGENIAAGYQTPEAVMAAWMASPGHRSNILDEDFNHLGVGAAEGNRTYGQVWEQMFVGDACSYSDLRLDAETAVLGSAQTVEDLDLTVSVTCSRHGTCVLPLTAGMYTFTQGGGELEVEYQGLSTALELVYGPWAAASPWAVEELTAAFQAGLISESLNGADFRQTMTRGEFAAAAVALYGALGGEVPAAGESPFTDTDDPAVVQAWTLGIVQGVGGGRFAPDEPLTREQAAVMLAQVWTARGGAAEGSAPEFSDWTSVSPWAREAVALLAGFGVAVGDPSGAFLPQEALTRESALLLAVRMSRLEP